jgi:hypothetical protein
MHKLGIGSTVNLGKQFVAVVGFRGIRDNTGVLTGCWVICKQGNGNIMEISSKAVEASL